MRLPDNNTKKIVLSAILCAVALALSLIDSSISSLFPVLPGLKLGLANIVSLFALYYLGLSYSLVICILRCLLTAVFSGNITMFTFSVFGGILSIVIMFILYKKISVIKVSVAGGLTHNLAQLFVAMLLTSTPQVFYYLPFLIISGTISGFFIGIICKLLFNKIKLKAVL